MAVNQVGNALSGGTSAWASDDDPELVREALPFALKTVEGLLDESPKHKGLLLTAASGFTQYGYAFVQLEADEIEGADLVRATAMRARARRLYRRGLEYGLRGLEVSHPGFRVSLAKAPAEALGKLRKEDVPLVYWTGLAWGAAISLAKEDSEMAADLSRVGMLMTRALELDEGFASGSIHDFFIAWDGGRPAAAGGSLAEARRHLERARQIARGRVGPLVTFAETVSVGTQDRVEFTRLLEEALAFDPDTVPGERLPNLIAQRRARFLLSRTDDLFLE